MNSDLFYYTSPVPIFMDSLSYNLLYLSGGVGDLDLRINSTTAVKVSRDAMMYNSRRRHNTITI